MLQHYALSSYALTRALLTGAQLSSIKQSMNIYIYIYAYTSLSLSIYIYIYTYVYVYVRSNVWPVGRLSGVASAATTPGRLYIVCIIFVHVICQYVYIVMLSYVC